MAERKAVNKYYPPEWTPSKGSINKFRGTHALRERARKLHMGILIIRFEMPFNIWCNGCENHIGMGVRYNAEKTKVGMYYTTPIYKFRMKCHLCTNHFEIQTDPQNLDYVILEGARRQERRWDPTDNEQVVPEDKDTQKKMALDAMFRMEHSVDDKTKQKALVPSLAQLEEYKERWRDDYDLNKILRQKFREKKKILTSEAGKDGALLKKYALNLTLLPESSEDKKLAGLLKFAPLNSLEEQQRIKRGDLISQSIFSPTPNAGKLFQHLMKENRVKAIMKSASKIDIGIVASNHKVCESDMTLECTDETVQDSPSEITEKATENELTKKNELFSAKETAVISDREVKGQKTSLVALDYNSSSSDEEISSEI